MKIIISENQFSFLLEQQIVSDNEKKDLSSLIQKSGYNKGTPEYEIAFFIGRQEGWGPKTRSFRNNNPGNLAGTDFKDIDPNVTLEPEGRYAKFSNPIFGIKSLVEKKIKRWANGNMPITAGNQDMIFSKKAGNKYVKGEKPTIAQFFYTYAPPNENDTEKYISNFLSAVGKGSTRDTKMITLLVG
jgi:hypothetical protein